MEQFCLSNNGINMVFGITEEKKLLLLHCGLTEFISETNNYEKFQVEEFRAFEIQISGGHIAYGHGTKNLGLSESVNSKYISHSIFNNEYGKKLEILLNSEKLEIRLNYQFFKDLRVIRSWTEVKNICNKLVNLEYVSSFVLYGIGKTKPSDHPYDNISLLTSYNASYRENQWRNHTLDELGFVASSKYSTTCHRINLFNTGSWSTKERLPKGVIINNANKENLYWQIEASGSWSFELSDYQSCLCFQLSGPNQTESQWIQELKSGKSFTSVTSAIAFSMGEPTDIFGEITKYTRLTRRKHFDNVELPIIFNPYMHNAGENPTEEQTIRDADGIKDLDIDYFCIDAGWHDEENYFKAIGNWEESKLRFKNGLNYSLDKIRQNGMKPGLWVEIEMIGIFNPDKDILSQDCFFIRGGLVVSNVGRIQLDFSSKDVIKKTNAILDRLMADYKIGYLKIDYNADCGAGSELNAKSLGEGLLRHNRAYIEWLKALMDRYPDLIVEGCASGGLRLDPLTQSVYSILSTSDQTNYRLYPYIASNMLTNGTPEQMAVWCYPLGTQGVEPIIMNVVNTLLGRIHLSGETSFIVDDKRDLLKEGLAYHRQITEDKIKSVPFFPLGINKFGSKFCCAGIKTDKKAYLAVWNLGDKNTVKIPLNFGKIKTIKNGFPSNFLDVDYAINNDSLTINFAGEQARVIEFDLV